MGYAKANNLWEIESPLKDFISMNQSFAVKNTGIKSTFGLVRLSK
ncbi:hypothetical protein [Peribacillus simplex]